MKYTIKTNAILKESNKVNINDMNFEVSNPVPLDADTKYPLEIQVDFLDMKVSIKETQIDELVSIVDKLEKYQKGKMSQKEVQKMINKLNHYSHLESIVQKMTNLEPLDQTEIVLLSSSTKHAEFVAQVNPAKIEIKSITISGQDIEILKNLDELNELLIKEFLNVVPDPSIQESLEDIFDEQERERIAVLKQKIQEIMGTDVKKKKVSKEDKVNKVDEYLREKQKMIELNSDSSFHVDIDFPLPQANNLDRIIALGKEVFNRGEAKINLEVLENDLDKRDVHYYTRALCYLKLAKIDEGTRDLCLTYEGEKFFRSSEDEKKDIIFSILNTDPLVKLIIDNNLDLNNPDHKKEFESRGIIADSTIARRISSLKSWITYLSM